MTKRNYLKSVSVGVIALGTLAIGLTAVLPVASTNAITQTINLNVENVIKLRVTSFNGKKLGKDNQGIFSWTQDNNAGETKNQRNKLTVTADVDADYEMKIDGKSVKQGKITAGKDSEIEFDLPDELGVGKHSVEFTAKGKDKQGDDVNATTKIVVNWTAVIPSVIPDWPDHTHAYDQDNDNNNGNDANHANNGDNQGEDSQGDHNQGKGHHKNHRRHGRNGRRGFRSPNTGYLMINGRAYSKSTIALVVALIAAGAIAITTRKVYARHLLSKKQK